MSESLMRELRAAKPAGTGRAARTRADAGGGRARPAALSRPPRMAPVRPRHRARDGGRRAGRGGRDRTLARGRLGRRGSGCLRSAHHDHSGASLDVRERTHSPDSHPEGDARRSAGSGRHRRRDRARPDARAALPGRAAAPGRELDELSRATQRAQQIASSLGGSVSSLAYDAPRGGIGSANIVLRVPIARVQSAMTQLSSLGTILGQRFGIDDLQPAVDTYTRQVEQTQRRIASLTKQLENPDLTEAERAILLPGVRRPARSSRSFARSCARPVPRAASPRSR